MGLILFLLTIQLLTISITFWSLFKARKLFDDRFAKNATMATSSISSFVVCMTLVFLLGFSFTIALIILIIGCIVGTSFGSLYKFQSVLLGYWNGWLGGLMGIMLGAVVLDPTLCSLPGQGVRDILENIYVFSIAGTSILMLSLWLVLFSLRV